MNRAMLVTRIAKQAKISKKSAAIALDSFIESINLSLKRDIKITLVGFGAFSVAKRMARIAKNPFTGESIKVPAKKVPKFKAGRELKKAVR